MSKDNKAPTLGCDMLCFYIVDLPYFTKLHLTFIAVQYDSTEFMAG